MDLTDEQLERLFGEDLPPTIVIIDLTPGEYPFIREGVQLLDDVAVMVYFDRPERRPDETIVRYLGELLAEHNYPLEHMVRAEVLRGSAQPAYPKPPRSLGRSIPARRQQIRGAKLTCGGWR